MSTNKTPTPKQQAKMAEILTAAVACFAAKGFHGTSTAEICQAAGMSPGNLFHYFPSKKAIIEAIVVQDSLVFEAVFSQYTDDEHVMDSILNIIQRLIAYMNAHQAYAKIGMEIAAEALRNPDIMAIFLATEAANAAKLSRLLAVGIEQGVIDAELMPHNTAVWLLTLVDGTLGRSIMFPDFDWGDYWLSLDRMVRKALAA